MLSYPKAWAERHAIAMVQEFMLDLRRGWHWQLVIMNRRGVKPHVEWGTTVDLE
jgi:hypothetical protein